MDLDALARLHDALGADLARLRRWNSILVAWEAETVTDAPVEEPPARGLGRHVGGMAGILGRVPVRSAARRSRRLGTAASGKLIAVEHAVIERPSAGGRTANRPLRPRRLPPNLRGPS
jgi:hypothetical protein